jgi:hypothetical protein
VSIDPGIALLIALAGALLFGSAAAHKLRAFGVFEATFVEYRILPPGLARPTAILVVMMECALTLGLLLPEWRAVSAVAGGALLSVYALAIGVNLLRGRRDLDCGCTLQHRPIGGWMIVRNLVLGALLLIAALPVSNRPLGVPDIATILATLLVTALLYMAADLLLGRAQSRQGYSMDAP